MPPTPVVRVDKPSYDYGSKIKVAPAVSRKLDKITFIKSRELPLCIYAMEKDFIVRPEISKIIRELRAGDFSSALLGNAILLLVLYGIWTLVSGADGFPIPVVHPRNGAVIAPANGSVQGRLNHPKPGGRFRLQMSQLNQCPANSMQASSFVKNGKISLRKAFDEVNRRASEIGCSNFNCPFERFRALAVEGKTPTETSVREAISALQGEMLGYYKNTSRGNYGKGIAGPDFLVEGIGEYSHVTHLEVKNPVGSSIEKASTGSSDIVKQGERIGLKISKQQVKWSNPNFVRNIPHVNQSEAFPQSPANMLGLVDTFDVPVSEKSIVENSVLNNSTNSSSVLFLNNEKNI